MYTPENDTNNTTPANGTNESPKAPAADPSYNPYLQEKVTEAGANSSDNANDAPGTDTNEATQPEQPPEEAKTASWDSAANHTDGTDGNANPPKCPRCGAVLRQGAKFCVSCGKSLQDPPQGFAEASDNGTEAPQQNPYAHRGTPVPPPADGYQNPPQYTVHTDPTVPEKLSVLDYFVLFLVTNIPVVGVILALYWGFSSQTGINRKNFARTVLILRVIQYVLAFLYVLLIVSIFKSAGGINLYNAYNSSILY